MSYGTGQVIVQQLKLFEENIFQHKPVAHLLFHQYKQPLSPSSCSNHFCPLRNLYYDSWKALEEVCRVKTNFINKQQEIVDMYNEFEASEQSSNVYKTTNITKFV